MEDFDLEDWFDFTEENINFIEASDSPPLIPASPPPHYCTDLLQSRSHGKGAVESRFDSIIGGSVTKGELHTLHEGLFNGMLPKKLTRDQKR
jgi:hypothetical protein